MQEQSQWEVPHNWAAYSVHAQKPKANVLTAAYMGFTSSFNGNKGQRMLA